MSNEEASIGKEARLFWDGRMREADEACAESLHDNPSIEDAIRLLIVRGQAAFDSGRVTDSIAFLRDATQRAETHAPALSFSARLALFSRESQFQSPEETLRHLSQVRQLAHAAGSAQAIGGLHLIVARLEALRGLCVNARKHLELSRRLLANSPASVQSAIHLLDAGLETYGGNFHRAERSAVAGLDLARANRFKTIEAGCLTNLGSVLLLRGRSAHAKSLLDQAVANCNELVVIRFSAVDALAQLAILEGNYAECARKLEECTALAQLPVLPARSWYDLAHQVTRCSYYEYGREWSRVIEIVDDTDPEVARRQYRALRTSLLCARARALARLGRHHDAEAALAMAVRACPRSAVDPLIVLETSKALCAALAGDTRASTIHFDRALAGCRAIGHHYHERWTTALRADVERVRAAPAPVARELDVTDAALLVTDVATIVGAGHSVDLMAHRIAALLQTTTMRSRVEVENEGNCEYQADPTATWTTDPDGTFRIELRGSDRRLQVRVRHASTIEEISLLKGLADVVQAGVTRAGDTEHEDQGQNLWPKAVVTSDEDAVFRSPRMIELLKIATRLASTDLPVLISGETGTGKEIFARLIHDNSRHRKGPFIPFNCSTVPKDLIESQLFGHRRGSFTGAHDSFPGMIRAAERGTLFLDELGDLDIAAQPKLLRFLETGEIQPIGEIRPQRIGVRLVAATNANLERLIGEGRFRRDLFYRIGVTVLVLPPLRERKDEIPALASYFLARSMKECHRTGIRLANDFVAALLLYEWPGNIRELANEIRRAVAMANDGDLLDAGRLAPEIARLWQARPARTADTSEPLGITIHLDRTLSQAVSELEEQFIEHALRMTGGRVAEAARILGLSRKGLFLKRRRRGLVGAAAGDGDAEE